MTYDPDGTAEPDYNDPNTRNNIILYVAFDDHAAEHWEYVGAYISDEKQSGSKFGWFVLKDKLHADEVAPLLIKTVTLGEEVVPYYSNINKTDAVRKLEKRLRREHRRFSRKPENEKQGGQTQGRNIEKQKLKLQRLYWKISNIRDNYIDRTIAEIVKTKPSFIAISDINVSRLMKNKYAAKYLLGQKLRRFRERLTSKCHETGIQLRVAERSFRSAGICSSCGLQNKGASKSSDTFRCSCGYTEDRSLNASCNLRDMVIYTTG